jgi:hypothetical protein
MQKETIRIYHEATFKAISGANKGINTILSGVTEEGMQKMPPAIQKMIDGAAGILLVLRNADAPIEQDLLGEFDLLNMKIRQVNDAYHLALLPRRIGDVPEPPVSPDDGSPANDSYVNMHDQPRVAGVDDGGGCPCIIL